MRCSSSNWVQSGTSDRKRATQNGARHAGPGSGSEPPGMASCWMSSSPYSRSPNVLHIDSREAPCLASRQVLTSRVFRKRLHQTIENLKNIGGIQEGSSLPRDHHEIKRLGKSRSMLSKPLPHLSANPIPHDGIPHRSTGTETQSRSRAQTTRALGIHGAQYDELRARSPLPLTRNAYKILRFEDPAGPIETTGLLDHDYLEATVTARRFRPLARRLFKIARPERDFIRSRKPCLRSRLIRLG